MLDLKPSKWIWMPVERTLPNTFVLFRKEIYLDEVPVKASGHLGADSRYRLTVNGKRIQWGPAPFDPRWMEADPVDISEYLMIGKNIIGIEVLWYGRGEGTYITSNPGLILNLDLDYKDGRKQCIVTDSSWMFKVDRAHRPGTHEQWFLRALQEVFDAREHPYGWDTQEYVLNREWRNAAELSIDSNKPPICAPAYAGGPKCTNPDGNYLKERMIPLLREHDIDDLKPVDAGRVIWKDIPEQWFDFRMKDCYEIIREDGADKSMYIPFGIEGEGRYMTFELPEQIVGWPYFYVEAPEGTIIELMEQESHDPQKEPWMDTHFFTWQRFICKEGMNFFIPFDYYSFRWFQLHIRGNTGPVKVYGAGAVRRLYDIPCAPIVTTSDKKISKVFDANINTMRNSILEVLSDGFGRERQQYSGDCGHELRVWRCFTGDFKLPARFISTYSCGMTLNGYFMDCWPGSDRLTRIAQRQLGLTKWGPILDHGIQFVFDCMHHYMDTNRKEDIEPAYVNLLKFASYIESIIGADGLLPVEDGELGIPCVWMDHHSYLQQKHKKCSFNLYAAAMLSHALSTICRIFGDDEKAIYYMRVGENIVKACTDTFWSPKLNMFIDNLPWLDEEGMPSVSDRTLSLAVIYDSCPGKNSKESVNALGVKASYEDFAKAVLNYGKVRVGLSYPANALWRYTALIKHGCTDIVLYELRNVWALMDSVKSNNTLAENWIHLAGTKHEWSHCPVAPIYATAFGMAGIRPAKAGFNGVIIEPALGDIDDLKMEFRTVKGTIKFYAVKTKKGHIIKWNIPEEIGIVQLIVPSGNVLNLPVENRYENSQKTGYLCSVNEELEILG